MSAVEKAQATYSLSYTIKRKLFKNFWKEATTTSLAKKNNPYSDNYKDYFKKLKNDDGQFLIQAISRGSIQPLYNFPY